MTNIAPASTPQAYLQAIEPLASARDRVLAGDAAALRAVSELSVAGEPDRHHRAVRALARPHPRLRRRGIARARGVFRHRRLWRGAVFQIRLGRTVFRPAGGRRARRHRRLCHQFHHLPVPAPHADHDHARPRPPGVRSRQQRALADRRLGRLAGRPHSGRCSACSNSISTATPPTAMRWRRCSSCFSACGGWSIRRSGWRCAASAKISSACRRSARPAARISARPIPSRRSSPASPARS